MSDAIRDLFIGVQIEGFDDELQTANDQLDQLVGGSEEGVAALDELSVEGQIAGDEIAEGMEVASTSIESFTEMLDGAVAGLAVVGAAGTKFMLDSLTAANMLEMNLAKLGAAIGSDLPLVVDTFEREVERLNHAVTVGDLAQWTLPIFAMFPEDAGMITKMVEPMNNVIMKMGGEASTAQMAWIALGTAVTGSYDMLIKASRRMPMAIIAGKEAYEVITKLSRTNDPLTNLAYTIEALELSTSTSMAGVNDMFKANEIQLTATQRAWGDFMEEAGAPLQPIQSAIAGWFRDIIEMAMPAGAAIGRFVAIAAGISTILAGYKLLPALITKALGVLGISFSLGPFLLITAAIVGASLVFEDFLAGFTGGESVIYNMAAAMERFFQSVDDWVYGLFSEKIPNAWRAFAAEFKGFFTITIPNLFIAVGHSIKEFFTVAVVNFFINAINKMIEYANKLPFVNIGLIPTVNSTSRTNATSTVADQIDIGPTGAVGDYIATLENEMNAPDVDYSDWEQRIPDLNMSQFLDGSVAPVPASMRLGSVFNLNIAEGAIVVDGSTSPEETADAVKEMLRDQILTEIEREIRGSVEEEVR